MPIKEIVIFGLGVVATLALLKGPQNIKRSMRENELKIMYEASRTDNWGNPSIFAPCRRNKEACSHTYK